VSHHSTFVWIAAFVLAVGGTARLTRLVTVDHYPPAAAIRRWWEGVTKFGPWSILATCFYCAAPYLAALNLAWAYIWDLQTAWWLVNGWLALSYAASIVVRFDGDDGDEPPAIES
jgi:hypothetical protein